MKIVNEWGQKLHLGHLEKLNPLFQVKGYRCASYRFTLHTFYQTFFAFYIRTRTLGQSQPSVPSVPIRTPRHTCANQDAWAFVTPRWANAISNTHHSKTNTHHATTCTSLYLSQCHLNLSFASVSLGTKASHFTWNHTVEESRYPCSIKWSSPTCIWAVDPFALSLNTSSIRKTQNYFVESLLSYRCRPSA